MRTSPITLLNRCSGQQLHALSCLSVYCPGNGLDAMLYSRKWMFCLARISANTDCMAAVQWYIMSGWIYVNTDKANIVALSLHWSTIIIVRNWWRAEGTMVFTPSTVPQTTCTASGSLLIVLLTPSTVLCCRPGHTKLPTCQSGTDVTYSLT